MGKTNRKSKKAGDSATGELPHAAAQSEARKIGRRLILKFVGEDKPELDRFEFRFKDSTAPVFWQRGDDNHSFVWTEVPQAFSILFLDYLWSASLKSSEPFFFRGAKNGSHAASLGDAIHQPKHRIHELFIETFPSGGTTSCVRRVFTGDNLHGKANRDRRVSVKPDFLPPDCVEVFWGERGPLAESGDVQLLANRIRESLGLPERDGDTNESISQTPTTPGPQLPIGEAPAASQPQPSPDEKIPDTIQKIIDRAKKLTDDDHFGEAIPVLEEALKGATEAKHKAAEAKIRLRLGHALFEGHEDAAAAEEHFRKALELAGESPSITRHAALHGLGDMLLWAGRLDEAGAVIRSGLAAAQAIADQDSIARSLISLGLLERALGKASEAAAQFDSAIEILHQLSLGMKGEKRLENAHALAVCYANKAQLARAEGHRDEALALYTKVQEQHAVSEDKLNSGKAHLEVGKMHCANADAEAGFQSFKRAMEIFLELKNSLWMARTASAFARLNAQHERWEEAAKAALAAQDGFEEANAKAERVESLLFTAEVFAQLVKWGLHENVRKQIHDICKTVPKELQPQAAAEFSVQMERVHAEIDEKVRTDEAIGRSINEAHMLAEKEQLHEERAECYLVELRLRTAKDDTDGRNRLRERALECFQQALAATNIPKRKARLMASIGGLCRELGRKTEWANWVKRVGEAFEKAGDVYGLATYYSEMGGVYCSLGRLDDEIASGRKMLELIEGRSFYDLAAAGRINLAHALRLRREFEEALRLLTEAEAICDTHKLQGMVGKIARIRSEIEEDVEASQAAQLSLPQLLCSLHQLVRFKPQDAAGYLAFWYYAWKTQLMSVLRSGPGVSLMVVTDNTERFMSFAARFANLAEHFAMATTTKPTAVAASRTLHIPPRWRYPVTYRFVAQVKHSSDEAADGNEPSPESEGDNPPNVQVVGPARKLPPYMHVSIGNGGSRISVADTPHLPPEALGLMLQRPIKELIQRHAVWFPSPRHKSDDPFLTDLRVGHEHGLFPVYFDQFPTSDAVSAIGGVQIAVPAAALKSGAQSLTDKWKRALLKITRLEKNAAQAALLDLPDAFAPNGSSETASQLEVVLFEFTEIGRKVFHPALVVR